MSSYFDEINREVRTIAQFTKEDSEAFLNELMRLEGHMKDDCLQLAGDRETPDDIRQKIIETIALHEIRYEGGEFLGDKTGACEATRTAVACRYSQLVTEMHSLFHTIASQRIQTRYGIIMDNPAADVRARNLHDAEVKNETV